MTLLYNLSYINFIETNKSPSVALTTWSMTHSLSVSKEIMKIKPILINTALALTLSGCLAQAESIEDQPQIDIVAKEYVFQGATSQLVCEDKAKTICSLIYTGKVKADQYDMYVQYALDDASVEFLDILNVVRHEEAVNAYVDRYEIEKINAAIAGGGK